MVEKEDETKRMMIIESHRWDFAKRIESLQLWNFEGGIRFIRKLRNLLGLREAKDRRTIV
jgi:hypothetical protein